MELSGKHRSASRHGVADLKETKQRDVAVEEEGIFVDLCDAILALKDKGMDVTGKMEDLRGFLEPFDTLTDFVLEQLGRLFPVIFELLGTGNPKDVKCALKVLVEITRLGKSPIPLELVEAVVSLAPSQSRSMLETVFRVMRNIGLPVLRFVSLRDLAGLAVKDGFAGAEDLAGMIYDVTQQGGECRELVPDFLQFIGFCFRERVEITFRYNLWTLVNLVESGLFDASLCSEIPIFEFVESQLETRDVVFETPALMMLGKLYARDAIPVDAVAIESILDCLSRSDQTRTNSARVLATVLEKHPELIELVMSGDGCVWKTLLEDHDSSNILLKQSGLALIKAIIQIVDSDTIQSMIEGGVFEAIADLLETRTALETLLIIVSKLASHPSFADVLAQMDELIPKPKIEELADQGDESVSSVARELLSLLG